MKPHTPDLPNFKAWSTENLAAFCTDAYLRMQEQAEELEQARLNIKAALDTTRKLIKEIGNGNNP